MEPSAVSALCERLDSAVTAGPAAAHTRPHTRAAARTHSQTRFPRTPPRGAASVLRHRPRAGAVGWGGVRGDGGRGGAEGKDGQTAARAPRGPDRNTPHVQRGSDDASPTHPLHRPAGPQRQQRAGPARPARGGAPPARSCGKVWEATSHKAGGRDRRGSPDSSSPHRAPLRGCHEGLGARLRTVPGAVTRRHRQVTPVWVGPVRRRAVHGRGRAWRIVFTDDVLLYIYAFVWWSCHQLFTRSR